MPIELIWLTRKKGTSNIIASSLSLSAHPRAPTAIARATRAEYVRTHRQTHTLEEEEENSQRRRSILQRRGLSLYTLARRARAWRSNTHIYHARRWLAVPPARLRVEDM